MYSVISLSHVFKVNFIKGKCILKNSGFAIYLLSPNSYKFGEVI